MGEKLRPLFSNWYSSCVRQCVVRLCRVKSMDSVGEGLGIKNARLSSFACSFQLVDIFFVFGA